MEVEAIRSAKDVVRRTFRAMRHRFMNGPRVVVEQATEDLQKNLARFLADYHGVNQALYMPLPEEAPCQSSAHSRTDFYFPLLRDSQLEFRRPQCAEAFCQGSFQILEPKPESSSLLDMSSPALICCPAVAVDLSGTRLGFGRGYYDRFFATHPGFLRVGVVFQIQVSSDPLPADDWDQVLDWIVTERMILRTQSTRSHLKWT